MNKPGPGQPSDDWHPPGHSRIELSVRVGELERELAEAREALREIMRKDDPNGRYAEIARAALGEEAARDE